MFFKKLILCALCISYISIGFPQSSTTIPKNAVKHPATPDNSYYADKWYHNSAEKNAIYIQIYRLSENIIRKKIIEQHLQPKKWGVILDIDETTLDNSQWNFNHDIHRGTMTWNAFARTETSHALPGVKNLIKNIHQLGGFVNFVSNRPSTLQKATENNLRSQGIYFDQVLLDTSNQGTSFVDKNPRFEAIEQGKLPSKLPPQIILAWFGDNIQDFPHLKQVQMIQNDPNSQAYRLFGERYFVFPNPLYGSWEKNHFE